MPHGTSILINKHTMENNKIRFSETHIYLSTKGRAEQSMPLKWFPKLANATAQQRADMEFSPFGIHWPQLDEDLSFEGFLKFDNEGVEV